MNTRHLSLSLICLLLINSSALGYEPKSIKNSDNNVSKKIQNLQKQIFDLNMRVWQLENNYKSAYFDTSNTNIFSRLRTNNGDFLVCIKNIEPYLDGVKVVISIGNLYSADFNGFKLNVEWGPRFDKNKADIFTWSKNLQKKEFNFINTIYSGAWNNVTLILAPVEPDKFGYLNISMETNSVSLRTIN